MPFHRVCCPGHCNCKSVNVLIIALAGISRISAQKMTLADGDVVVLE